MRSKTVAVVIALLAIAAVVVGTLWWNNHRTTSKASSSTNNGVTQIAEPAEPGVGGFYQIKWQCHGTSQQVSFSILTQGEGTLRVVIEDINPSTQPYSVTQVLTEDVTVSDANRDEVESRTFSALIQRGHHVHFGLSGASGARNSEDHTFPSLVC